MTRAGFERVEYQTRLRDGPLRLHGFLERANTPAGFRGQLNLSIDLRAWVGHRLPELPAIERIQQLAAALSRAKRSYLQFTIDGVPIEPPTELDAEIAPALAGQLARALELHVAICDAAKKLGVTPKLPDLVLLSDEAFEQVAALLELCRTGELAAAVKPIETEADCALLDGVELPERLRRGRFLVTERNPAELFGSRSEHYLLVRHLGPFTLAVGHEPVQEGGRVRLKLKTVEGAQVVYRLQRRADR